jgi:hypothetical protein
LQVVKELFSWRAPRSPFQAFESLEEFPVLIS